MTNHVSYLFLANLVTIVSQVVFAPLLTRYYTPEAYGLFSAFISAGINISTILSLRYENALLLETNEKNRNLIAGMIVTLGFAGGLLMTIFILSFPGFLSQLVGTGNSTLMLLMIPVFVVVNIFFIVTGVEVTLTNKYRDSFFYGSPAMVGSKVYSLAYSVFINGHFAGLFTSDIISRLALVIIRLTISLKKGVKSYLIISHQQVMAGLLLLKKYRRFPIYDLPATYINIFVGQAPVYFLTALKQTAILGWLGISLSMLEMPLRLMSYSLAPVLMQRAGSMRDDPAGFQKILESLFRLFSWPPLSLPLFCSFGGRIFLVLYLAKTGRSPD